MVYRIVLCNMINTWFLIAHLGFVDYMTDFHMKTNHSTTEKNQRNYKTENPIPRTIHKSMMGISTPIEIYFPFQISDMSENFNFPQIQKVA
jgi:hypothetical protein